jgi:UDP-N-acetylmuramyl tripeptide synthase
LALTKLLKPPNSPIVILQLLGRHNIDNALAASACAWVLGIDIKLIKQGLEKTQAEKGRFRIYRLILPFSQVQQFFYQ